MTAPARTATDRDPFPRPTATVAEVGPWLVELGSTVDGLVRAFASRPPVDPRYRERVMLAVAEANDCRTVAFVHGSWGAFLGETERGRVDEAVLGHARACAEAGEPLDPAPLRAVLPPEAVRTVRAVVAGAQLSSLVGNTADGLLARLTRKRPLDPSSALGEAVVLAATAPLSLGALGLAALARAVARTAPPVPEVTMPPAGRANLLAHLLAQAAPAYLANAAVRTVLLRLPVNVSVGVRAGRTTATVTVGRNGVEVRNGLTRDAVVIVEGDVEPLLRFAAGDVVRELGAIRVRPNP